MYFIYAIRLICCVERILYDIIGRAKVDCGLTGISDLTTNARDDRMESFVLSETLKVSLSLLGR